MVNYKSFKLPGDAKLRVRTDSIIATVSSKASNSMEIYVANVTTPWRIRFENDQEVVDTVDYVWERNAKEKEGDL